MTVIVDTNVAVVAGRTPEDKLSEDCITACVEWIGKINDGEIKFALDSERRIIDEYRKRLESMARFSIGYQFYKWVALNRENDERCDLVPITPVDGSEINFEEFPRDPELANFDSDDRKFVAVACAHPDNPPILQAVDRDWWNFRDALHQNGVTVKFLCEDYMQNP